MSKLDNPSTDTAYASFSNISPLTVLQSQLSSANGKAAANTETTKITFDQIASVLLKNNLVLTALEFHTELAEIGKELPRLRDYFSNPANFEQQSSQHHHTLSNMVSTSSLGGDAGFPLHKASSIQTFDSLDLTRYSDDVDQNKYDQDNIAVLEFELRKAKETINQLRNTLTIATGFIICFEKMFLNFLIYQRKKAQF